MTFVSLSHTVWSAGSPIDEDHTSQDTASRASCLLFSILTVGSVGEQVTVLCPNNDSSAGPLVCPSVKLGRSQKPCSTGWRLWGGPCWHLIQVSRGTREDLREPSPTTPCSCRFPTPPSAISPHYMDSGVASTSCIKHPGCAVLVR